MKIPGFFWALSGLLFLSIACESVQGTERRPSGGDECPTACGTGQSCQGGVCLCDSSLLTCDGTCVEAAADSRHCGSCGNACTTDELCSAGACVPLSQGCGATLTPCDGSCVDTNASVFHCGTCSNACDAGEDCTAGVCEGGAAGSGGSFGSGGNASTGGSGNSGGSTGSGGSSSSGGSSGAYDLFDQCRFHFGTFRDPAANNSAIRNEIDFFIPGWMGISDTFDQEYVCDDVKGVLAGKVPVVVAYVSAFYAKREENLNDCDVGQPDLCTYGAEIIQNDLSQILAIYESYAQGYANCLPSGYPIIFEMEPDWYQYTVDDQEDPMTPEQAGSIMSQYVQAIKEHLPQATFSLDISPWVLPSNGGDQGADWYSNFDLSLFTFINTSGGGTLAANTKIRSANDMTWGGVHGVTGKPIIADTGYGTAGVSTGHDSNWDNVSNINARIANGVFGVAQYNPKGDWGQTLSSIRSQLNPLPGCD